MSAFAPALAVADAVLYEGYILYPYTASARKNRSRFQFGVAMPPNACGAGDRASLGCEFVAEVADATAELTLRARFLQLVHRTVEANDGSAVERLAVDGLAYLPWDEASERTFDLALALGAAFERELPFEIAGGEAREPLAAADGTPVGTLVRRWAPLRGRIVASASPSGAYRSLRIALENTGAALEGSSRDAALEAALLSAHVLLAVRGGRILSTIDPPDDARALVDGAKPNGLWLVLAGEPAPDEHASTVALAAPIILYDFPKVSAKTQGDAFDATEIDELLHLSVLSLSDEERAEARATDPRARAIVERAERLSAERIGELHDGTLERFGSDPFAQLDLPAFDCVFVGGTKVAKGSLVRLRPQRRADIWDRFLVGKLARVQAIHQDLEDRFYVAVTVEDDPASEYHEWYGRSFFFDPDEVEPVAAGDAVR